VENEAGRRRTVMGVGEAGSSMSVSIVLVFVDFASSSVMILCRREGPSVGSVRSNSYQKRRRRRDDKGTVKETKDVLITAITGSSGYGRPGNRVEFEFDSMTAFETASTVGFCRLVIISYSWVTLVSPNQS
jgi:hypothetical protein